jgi:hypothetical protein
MQGILLSFSILFVVIIISFFVIYKEPFTNSDVQMCGVNHGPCPAGLTCINGYCNSGAPPTLPTYTGLPVIP